MDETPLERARWYVADQVTLVATQIARVADLARRGLDTTQAKATLAVFETTLRFMREDLAREQERAAARTLVQCEVRVAHQAACVVNLTRRGRGTAQAEVLLSTMKESLHLMRVHFADAQAAGNGNQP